MPSAACPLHPQAELIPVVEGAADRFWGCDGAFDYGRCPECGTWVLDPRPAPSAIGPFYAHYYSEAELAQARRAYGGLPSSRAFGIDKMRAQQVIARLKRLGATLDGRRLLDVGCGLGGFARAMRALAGMVVRGADFDPKCVAIGAELHGIEVDAGELAGLAYPEGTYDVVSSWHCLEHTYDPAAELAEMARITRPGGWLVLEVPTPSVWARVFRGRWFFLQAPTHLYHLRPATLRTLLRQSGWAPVRMERPWAATELAGSVVMALGLTGFAPRLLFGPKGLAAHLWRLLFWALLPLDLVVTGVQAALGRGGVLRVYARRDEA